jgi:hypothetical protein
MALDVGAAGDWSVQHATVVHTISKGARASRTGESVSAMMAKIFAIECSA